MLDGASASTDASDALAPFAEASAELIDEDSQKFKPVAWTDKDIANSKGGKANGMTLFENGLNLCICKFVV
ncbi:hypothetical protein BCV02_13820 [Vibrio breoganii]|uniref:Uncharacterized protein n=1 Tax=Vibrio breoganii TaxID=553239 RepID=A0AAP8MW56_9VIBR|nr:hypothetical protein A6D95_05345 [Vibrio breoganii]OED83216.1 hypothetical protein A1QE_14825 [Vibrio breoganii ZF-55]PMF70241.1 hypothetical protein BCV08_03040 [Vibrio breoganii]PMG01611.1 hypothetical protein BCV02_13820 [Vibrio breoganii]PMG95042.1 hypothetical protein BCU79_10670 [Vibrio breoganii]